MDDILGSTVAQPLNEYIVAKVAHEMAMNFKLICINLKAGYQRHLIHTVRKAVFVTF